MTTTDPAPVGSWQLARTFNQIALQSFGGGLGAWSRQMLVTERKWLTEDEFLTVSTLCRVLPGANQINLAVFVGMRMAGSLGAAAAVTGLLAVPALLVLIAGSIYTEYSGHAAVRGFLAGMAAAAIGLTFSVAWQQARKTLRAPMPLLLAGVTAGATLVHAPLWATLLIVGPIGFYWAWRTGS